MPFADSPRVEVPVITRKQVRDVLGDGGRVVDQDGRPVGRMLDVVLDALTFLPAWASVECHLCPGDDVLVPLVLARDRDGSVEVPYTALDVCGAPRADAAGRRNGRHAEELRRYYETLDDGVAPRELGDVGQGPARAPTPSGSGAPVTAANGHRRIDGAGYEPTPGTSGSWSAVRNSSPGPPWWARCQRRWPSVATSLPAMRLELRSLLELTALSEDEREDLILAAGEAATNAVEHPRFPTVPFIDISVEVGENRACIVIQDHGRWRPRTDGGDRGRGLRMMGLLAEATLSVGSDGTRVVLRNRVCEEGRGGREAGR
jgi:anti-sigma regulatory factor (Ser/Thr protein kinase)